MNKPKQDSKIKQEELHNEENTELTDEALEKVSGGTFALNTETQPYSSYGWVRGKISQVDYNFTTPRSDNK